MYLVGQQRQGAVLTHSLVTYILPFEIGWSFATVFIGCKTWSSVTTEHKMNLTGKPDLGKDALKEKDQFPCDLQAISLAFSFPTYYTNSSFTSSPAQDSTFFKAGPL